MKDMNLDYYERKQIVMNNVWTTTRLVYVARFEGRDTLLKWRASSSVPGTEFSLNFQTFSARAQFLKSIFFVNNMS